MDSSTSLKTRASAKTARHCLHTGGGSERMNAHCHAEHYDAFPTACRQHYLCRIFIAPHITAGARNPANAEWRLKWYLHGFQLEPKAMGPLEFSFDSWAHFKAKPSWFSNCLQFCTPCTCFQSLSSLVQQGFRDCRHHHRGNTRVASVKPLQPCGCTRGAWYTRRSAVKPVVAAPIWLRIAAAACL